MSALSCSTPAIGALDLGSCLPPLRKMQPKYCAEKSTIAKICKFGSIHLYQKVDKETSKLKTKAHVYYLNSNLISHYQINYDKDKGIWMRGEESFNPQKPFGFVLNNQEQLLIFTDRDELMINKLFQEIKYFDYVSLKHSSLTCGGPVYFAGNGVIEGDNSFTYNNRSGHYQPEEENVKTFQSWLTKQGVVSSKFIGNKKFVEKSKPEKSEGKSKSPDKETQILSLKTIYDKESALLSNNSIVDGVAV